MSIGISSSGTSIRRMPAKRSKQGLKQLLKEFQKQRKNPKNKENSKRTETPASRALFGACIGDAYSKVLSDGESYRVEIWNDGKPVLLLSPEEIRCCEGILGMKVDRQTDYIANTPRRKRIIDVNELTDDPNLNDLVYNTLKFVAGYAKKAGDCRELVKKENYTLFILETDTLPLKYPQF